MDAGFSARYRKTPLAYDHCISPLRGARLKRKSKPCPLQIGKVYIGVSQINSLHVS
jgi:hypothetical protein